MPKFKEFNLPDGVRQIAGEAGRYYVRSRTNLREEHLVDVTDCGFNGACSCRGFQFTHLKKLNADRAAGQARRKHRCYHIRRALYYQAEVTSRVIYRHQHPETNHPPSP